MESFLSTTQQNKNKKSNKGSKKRRAARRTVGKSNSFRYLANNDLTMQFDSSKDPIYFAFEYLEQRTVPQLVGDFLQDTFFEISSLVSKVVKK